VDAEPARRAAGLSGPLRDDLQTNTDGRVVIATVHAMADDVRRRLRASSLVREPTAR